MKIKTNYTFISHGQNAVDAASSECLSLLRFTADTLCNSTASAQAVCQLVSA